ncbi:hypothetical protein [Clostridium manihotivorum]|nr:hypothetical protein [Clostridium manihotivorum]
MDYYLDIDFLKYYLAKNYLKNGKRCIFDPIRKMLVIETPEEIVRQK